MTRIFINFEMLAIRDLFRDFYGSLPVLELYSNKRLIKNIEEIEKQLRGLLDDESASY